MATKLVENIDDFVWRRFRAFCVRNSFSTGAALSDILDKFLKRRRL